MVLNRIDRKQSRTLHHTWTKIVYIIYYLNPNLTTNQVHVIYYKSLIKLFRYNQLKVFKPGPQLKPRGQ